MSQKPLMFGSDKGWDAHVTIKEIKALMDQQESLDKWLDDNIGHTDWEKVNRQRNNLQLKITVREQRIERHRYPARFQQEESHYIFTQKIL